MHIIGILKTSITKMHGTMNIKCFDYKLKRRENSLYMNYGAKYSEQTLYNIIALNLQPRSTLSLYLLLHTVPWKGLSYSV